MACDDESHTFGPTRSRRQQAKQPPTWISRAPRSAAMLLAVLMMMALGSGKAWGGLLDGSGDCPNGASPSTECYQVCYKQGPPAPADKHVWKCDIEVNGYTADDAAATVVWSEDDGANGLYVAWGVEGYEPGGYGTGGREFCCTEVRYDTYWHIFEVQLFGTTHHDEMPANEEEHIEYVPEAFGNNTLSFTYDDGTEYNLSNHDANHDFFGAMHGLAGDDVLWGSNDDTGCPDPTAPFLNLYCDRLFGEEGEDWIDAGDGSDLQVMGGADNDTVRGGPGVDSVYGDDGVDVVCGGDGDGDYSHGGAGIGDTAWDESSGDTVAGGPDGNDECGTSASGGPTIDGSCESTIYAAPDECTATEPP